MTIYDDRPWLASYDTGIAPDIDIPAKTYTDILMEGLTMAPHKVPKIIEFIEAISLTAVGKADKKALR